MIPLTGQLIFSGNIESPDSFLLKLTRNSKLPLKLRESYGLLCDQIENPPEGFRAYVKITQNHNRNIISKNAMVFGPELGYLSEGDIVRVNTKNKKVRVLYRKNSSYNALLVTERCNSFCLMCSQPPRKVNDDAVSDELLQMIPMIDRGALEIGITGGEPTIIGEKLFEMLRKLKAYHPETAVHLLTNGRNFQDINLARSIQIVGHPNLMLGIPLYSDLSNIHDFVVQADGAFDETIRGILNLKRCCVQVEIRIVIHKQTYDRLPQLARFIARNLTFVDQVALMGLEITGFTKANIDELWIDPSEYQEQLIKAVEQLDRYGIRVLIYNHQLCLLDPSIHKFNVRSISDWKNEYMPECDGCLRQYECGGFFSSSKLRYSSHIRPFTR